MIETLLFDFGDVFLDLNKQATPTAFQALGLNELTKGLQQHNEAFEVGNMDAATFIKGYQTHLPQASAAQIQQAWNAMLGPLPAHRLAFLKTLAHQQNYQLLLFSNTNALHIDWVEKNVPAFTEFKSYFDGFYLSHEIRKRKPNADAYRYILNQHSLNPAEVLFIDDTKANTDAAKSLGLQTWNLQVGKEDVSELFTINQALF